MSKAVLEVSHSHTVSYEGDINVRVVKALIEENMIPDDANIETSYSYFEANWND